MICLSPRQVRLFEKLSWPSCLLVMPTSYKPWNRPLQLLPGALRVTDLLDNRRGSFGVPSASAYLEVF